MRLLLLFIACLLVGCSQNDDVLQDTQNHSVHLSELHGKWIIINYWASWCESCMYEIPELNHFYQDNHDKNVLLYGVSYDHDTPANLKQIAFDHDIQFPVLLNDPDTIWHLGAISAVPTTFIIDPQGKVADSFIGPTTEQDLFSTLERLQKNFHTDNV